MVISEDWTENVWKSNQYTKKNFGTLQIVYSIDQDHLQKFHESLAYLKQFIYSTVEDQ